MIQLKYIEVTQPIGTFYITVMNAVDVARIADIQPRRGNPLAVQREESKKRIKEIADYCSDTDATFPTPIIISIYSDAAVGLNDFISFDLDIKIGEIIDGQHRIKGLIQSNKLEQFELPVIMMFNLTDEEKAYVFSIINSKQTKVSMSLIYDLFALADTRSPFKTAHETARALNKDEASPLFNRLKMLGKKEPDQFLASLSQGTFVKYLLELISKNPDEDTRRIKNGEPLTKDVSLIFREYFISEKDTVIYKVLLNLLTGVRNAFPKEWDDPKAFILSKSIGFGAIMKSLPVLYHIGDSQNDLSKDFFTAAFNNVKDFLQEKGIQLTSQHFGSNEQARTRLADLIIEGVRSGANKSIAAGEADI